MREYEGTINSSRCLVAGYGRIGRILSQMLRGLGANVTVSARKYSDLAYIRSCGMKAVVTGDFGSGYDIIFNTIPELIFDSHTLAGSACGALVIDLASLPGGVDFDAAKRLNIKAIRALSLPGRSAPQTSGIIIKNAVYNIIREENL
ncbi:MAG: dipicolinate synthase [Clostridia bacterium]|nr:dipicolinate synthase [Clostridia bacterium]